MEGFNSLHPGTNSADILPSSAESIQYAPVVILPSPADNIQHVSLALPRISIEKGTQRASGIPHARNIQHVQKQINSHIHLGHTSRSLGLFPSFSLLTRERPNSDASFSVLV